MHRRYRIGIGKGSSNVEIIAPKDSTSLTVKVSSTDPVVNDAEQFVGTCNRDGSTFKLNCSLWERRWVPEP